jgi:trimeric autotransporter adhesin
MKSLILLRHLFLICLIAIFASSLWLTPSTSFADEYDEIYTVDDTDDDGDYDLSDGECDTTDGTGDPICTLRAALEQANDDTSITYQIVLGGDTYCLGSALKIYSDITLTGSSDGTTIIDGGNSTSSETDCAASPSGTRLMRIYSGSTANLDYITMQGGSLINYTGAGIHMQAGIDLELSNSHIKYNQINNTSGVAKGAGIYITAGSDLALTDSSISNNTITNTASSVLGGAVYLDSTVSNPSSITLTDSTISNNTISTTSSSTSHIARGGAFYMHKSSTITSTGSTISDNTAFSATSYANGGAIFLHYDASLTFDTTVLSDNAASSTDHYASGGAIHLYATSTYPTQTFTMTDSTVSGNSASSDSATTGHHSRGGGIYIQQYTDFTATGTTFSGNSATIDAAQALGGALYNYIGCNITFINSTFSGNSVTSDTNQSKGGAIYSVTSSSVDGSLSFRNTTITDNTSTSTSNKAWGGGSFSNSYTTLSSKSTIISGNTVSGSTSEKGADCYGTVVSYGYNFIPYDSTAGCSFDLTGLSGDDVGTDYITLPHDSLNLESTLTSNGGSNKTHALESDCPAINTGSCEPIDSSDDSVTTDQRGYTRDDSCDIGAYEYISDESNNCSDDIDNDGNGDTDASDSACAVCGDGTTASSETCDDGNDDNKDECTTSCLAASCGDGYTQSGEECDDGNTTDSDGCSSTCTTETSTATTTTDTADDGNDSVSDDTAIDDSITITDNGGGDDVAPDGDNAVGGGGGCSLQTHYKARK